MDKRLKAINMQLTRYSRGRFDGSLLLSRRLDEVDAISNGINMLGEDLKAITISRNYFNNIFHSVSDMVFVITPRGIIKDTNRAVEQLLHFSSADLCGRPVAAAMKSNLPCFRNITGRLKLNPASFASEGILYSREGAAVHVKIHAAYLKDEHNKALILITASDITYRVKTENIIIRAIIDTQEKERQRLAQDLHDGLSQQLTAIKFFIGSTAETTRGRLQKNTLLQSGRALGTVIADIRNICFNLMPGTLLEFGLIKAVKEFCSNVVFDKSLRIVIKQHTVLPAFTPELNIDLYRIIQEFVSNAVRHGQAKRIVIAFRYVTGMLALQLQDNGLGFDTARVVKGMGLQNVRSRVTSHNGRLAISSIAGNGTRYMIQIPVF